ncbi:MAG: polyprenyl synthetase family protein [Anaerolineae bacterium]
MRCAAFAPRSSTSSAISTDDSGIEYPLVAELLRFVFAGGGKRLRPALVFLVARLGHADKHAVLSLAAAVETLHTATLVHDDLVDGALLRRGLPALNVRWSPGATVLAGDWLFARAAGFAADTNDVRVQHIRPHAVDDHRRRAAPAVRPPRRADGRRVRSADLRQNGVALRGRHRGHGAARRPARAAGGRAGGVRPVDRHGVPDRRRHPRLHGRCRSPRQAGRQRPALGPGHAAGDAPPGRQSGGGPVAHGPRRRRSRPSPRSPPSSRPFAPTAPPSPARRTPPAPPSPMPSAVRARCRHPRRATIWPAWRTTRWPAICDAAGRRRRRAGR